MRIISNFKDYYDTAVGYGVDMSLVYIRKSEVYTGVDDINKLTNGRNIIPQSPLYMNKEVCRATPAYLFFCGTVYKSLKIVWFNKGCSAIKTEYLFNFGIEDVPKVTSSFFSKRQMKEFINSPIPQWVFTFFESFKSPCVLYEQDSHYWGWRDSPRLTIDPCLKELGFQKVVDPFTTFQEIYMYFTNILVSEREVPVEIEDKYRAQAHGFDDKSFKGPKKIKKRKQKRNK